MKQVTLETLVAAMRDSSDGQDVYATFVPLAQAIYDALPAPALDTDVLAGAAERERLREALAQIADSDDIHQGQACGLDWCGCYSEAAQAALAAMPPDAVADEWARLRAENERLKAACALALDWCETDNDSIERLAEEVAPALRTALHGEATDGR